MSLQTQKDLRNLFIYQVYVRNHTPEGTFKAFNNDLDRIQDLGVDFIYFLPIHEIGQECKKGSLGSPYSIKDYRSVNPELGTLEDFQTSIKEIHKRGMKVMMDIVFNHTSHDSVLLQEHPEYFYKNEEGKFANRVGDWWDITDLDYTNDIGLWEDLIETLEYWTKLGVDGYRWDVASLLPLEFLEEAHERVLDINPNVIFLSESVHGGFTRYMRNQGFECLCENEIYQVFDMAYDYDIHPYFEGYLKGENSFKRYMEALYLQEESYPNNYVKMRNLENHDFGRFAPMVNFDSDKIDNWNALNFFSKGSTMIYGGQEFTAEKLPSLFDKDTIDMTGRDLSNLITVLAKITKDKIFSYGFYDIELQDKDVYVGHYTYLGRTVYGIFNVGLESGSITLDLTDGSYKNLIDDSTITITDQKLVLSNKPLIFEVK